MSFHKTLTLAVLATAQLAAGFAQPTPFANPPSAIEQRVDIVHRQLVQNVQMLASVDIGSGSTKVTVAEVDCINRRIMRIWQQQIEDVPLRADLTKTGGVLSQAIEQKLIATLQQMISEAAPYRPVQWSGVATSVFRTAPCVALLSLAITIAWIAAVREVGRQLDGTMELVPRPQ